MFDVSFVRDLMRKPMFELCAGDYVFGVDRAVFRVVEIKPLEAHDVSVTFEATDGKQTLMLADMGFDVEIASLLDWLAQA